MIALIVAAKLYLLAVYLACALDSTNLPELIHSLIHEHTPGTETHEKEPDADLRRQVAVHQNMCYALAADMVSLTLTWWLHWRRYLSWEWLAVQAVQLCLVFVYFQCTQLLKPGHPAHWQCHDDPARALCRVLVVDVVATVSSIMFR